VRLNRRTAPTIYRRVVAVTRERGGSLAIDGAGTAVDWLVEMNRFAQEALLDRLAASGRLDLELMPPLADAIASFHEAAERRSDHGGTAGMKWVIDGNAAGFVEHGATCLDPSARSRVIEEASRELDRWASLLDTRRQSGFVRQCHGDLHLRNIVLLDGQPTLFDGVEFNDEISCTDVHYDLAFLLMDLWRRRLPRHANTVWNRYLVETGDLDGLSLLPLFLSCRAAVRAKTSATAARLQNAVPRRGELEELAREYLLMAEQLLHPPTPALVAIGGLSGSGKSRLAASLAPSVGAVPGAVIVRSDEIRKRLCGASPLERLGPDGYSPQVSQQVYAILAERAGVIVRAGHAAIVDAVYVRPEDRQVIERAAVDASVPFVGLWLDAPESTLLGRIAARRNDPSDATAEVLRLQRTQESGVIEWHRLNASTSSERVLRSAEAFLPARTDGGPR
jgi:aminoglycoside phosphotransferase family enzyme/predicted kinase